MAATEFDREFKLVTSYAFKPIILSYIRLLVALYVLAVLIFQFAWEGSKHTGELDSYVHVLLLLFVQPQTDHPVYRLTAICRTLPI